MPVAGRAAQLTGRQPVISVSTVTLAGFWGLFRVWCLSRASTLLSVYGLPALAQ